jgi:putative oxidoreductase
MNIRNSVAPISRFLMSGIFLAAGFSKIRQREGTLQYMHSKNLPMARYALPLAAATEIAGGISMLTGLRGRWGAGALAAFLVPTSLVFHDFWRQEGMERSTQQINFLKNLALIGGLLSVVSQGTGAYSLDHGVSRVQERRRRERELGNRVAA